MNYRIRVMPPAEWDVRDNHAWWAKNRSAEQADRWFDGIHDAMQTLKQMPRRCPVAIENDLFDEEIRQLAFGLGQRPSHRVLFSIVGSQVVIYRVRALAQDELGADDLTE